MARQSLDNSIVMHRFKPVKLWHCVVRHCTAAGPNNRLPWVASCATKPYTRHLCVLANSSRLRCSSARIPLTETNFRTCCVPYTSAAAAAAASVAAGAGAALRPSCTAAAVDTKPKHWPTLCSVACRQKAGDEVATQSSSMTQSKPRKLASARV